MQERTQHRPTASPSTTLEHVRRRYGEGRHVKAELVGARPGPAETTPQAGFLLGVGFAAPPLPTLNHGCRPPWIDTSNGQAVWFRAKV